MTGSCSRIAAFESVAFNFYCCLANLLCDNIANVEVHSVALGGSQSASFALRIPCAHSLGQVGKRNNGIYCSGQGEQGEQVVVAPVCTGDRYLGEMGNDLPSVLIKIDCEGAELDVLLGLRRFLSGSINQTIVLAVDMLDPGLATEIYQFLVSIRPVKLHAKRGTEFIPVANFKSLPIPSPMIVIELPCSCLKE